jgi:hypothetical protein
LHAEALEEQRRIEAIQEHHNRQRAIELQMQEEEEAERQKEAL